MGFRCLRLLRGKHRLWVHIYGDQTITIDRYLFIGESAAMVC
jgi:hypothetical protein